MKLKKWEFAVLAALLAVCAGLAWWFYMPRSGDTIAVISVDGQERYRVDLSSDWEPFTFSIEGQTGKPVSFEVRDHQIRFVQVTCPDHLCEKAGWCRQPNDRAVCMPNRTILICYARGELSSDGSWEWIRP